MSIKPNGEKVILVTNNSNNWGISQLLRLDLELSFYNHSHHCLASQGSESLTCGKVLTQELSDVAQTFNENLTLPSTKQDWSWLLFRAYNSYCRVN